MKHEKIKKDEKTQYITGFLDCCYSDLRNVKSKADRRYWGNQFSMIGFRILDDAKSHGSEEVLDSDWRHFEAINQEIEKHLAWFFENFQKETNIFVDVPHVFSTIRDEFNFSLFEDLIASGGITVIIKKDEKEETKMVSLPFFKFIRSLHGFPRNSLIKCPECNRIFFNPSKREMKYCSSKCRSNAGVQRFREKKDVKPSHIISLTEATKPKT